MLFLWISIFKNVVFDLFSKNCLDIKLVTVKLNQMNYQTVFDHEQVAERISKICLTLGS